MESDFKITINGLPEEIAVDTGTAVATVVRKIEDAGLDFRRMHQIILTTDLATELATVEQKTKSKKPITFTNEEYATAIAKVFIIPRNDDYEILLIFNAYVAANLITPETAENYDESIISAVVHFLHHELCHVHDDKKKLTPFHP